MVRSTLKGYGLTDAEQKRLIQTIAGRRNDAQGTELPPLPTDLTLNPTAPGQYEPGSDDEGTDQDPVLTRLYQLLSQSKSKAEMLKLSADIQERETFLYRSSVARDNRAQRGKGKDANLAKSLALNPTDRLDITNLAPHADAIAGELVGWVKSTGLLPEALTGTAVSTLAGIIKSNPDIVKKGLDAFSGVISKYAPSQKGGQQAQTVPVPARDPAHPENWAPQMGYR